MPEIKISHIVSFSSEDKVHKAENLLKPETYHKWKCSPGREKAATVTLQLEKASVIHSIHIGNEHSAFVEVLVGRSSDQLKDFQVLLVASSFMSPLESRNSTNPNRVRLFDRDSMAKNLRDDKWDVVQIVCTQPFNKTTQYGLSFIKFHSPPDPSDNAANEADSKKSEIKIGKFKLIDDKEKSPLRVGSYYMKKKDKKEEIPLTSPSAIRQASYAAATLANLESQSPTGNDFVKKRKLSNEQDVSSTPDPPSKKPSPMSRVNKEKIGYKNILGDDLEDDGPSSATKKVFSPSVEKTSSSSVTSDAKGLKTQDDRIAKTLNEGIIKKRNDQVPSSKNEASASKQNKAKGESTKLRNIPLNKIMKKVVFALSGFQNPKRSEIRDAALEMGAKYKADWDSTCTHLICAFVNTPKYIKVRSEGGRVVRKDWILDCHKEKKLLPWRKYILGRYSKDSITEDESSDEDTSDQTVQKAPSASKKYENKSSAETKSSSPKQNSASNQNSDSSVTATKRTLFPQSHANPDDKDETSSETGVEDDYLANTDIDSDSGGDTEDEIRKFKQRQARKNERKRTGAVIMSDEERDDANGFVETKEDIDELRKPDTKDIPLMDLPDFFKGKNFFLYGDFSGKELHDLERYITAYNGRIADYMGTDVKYVVTKSKWSKSFDDALTENDNLIFVRPAWIHRCHQSVKLMPFQPYIVVPDS